MLEVKFGTLSATFTPGDTTWNSDNARVVAIFNGVTPWDDMSLPYAPFYVGKRGVNGLEGIALDALRFLSEELVVVKYEPSALFEEREGEYV